MAASARVQIVELQEVDDRRDEGAEGGRPSRGSRRARRESAVPESVITTAEASGSSRQIQAAAATSSPGAS